MWNINQLKNLEKDDLLHAMGLQTRRTTADWVLPSIGLFGLGLLVGASVGMLLAPKSGREMREDLRGRLHGANELSPYSSAPAASADRTPRVL